MSVYESLIVMHAIKLDVNVVSNRYDELEHLDFEGGDDTEKIRLVYDGLSAKYAFIGKIINSYIGVKDEKLIGPIIIEPISEKEKQEIESFCLQLFGVKGSVKTVVINHFS